MFYRRPAVKPHVQETRYHVAYIYIEYTDIQCNKRNTYRRKVKEEKQANAQLDGDQGPTEGDMVEGMNGAVNGHANGDDEDRPLKKIKGEDGTAFVADVDELDDEDMDDTQDAGLDEEEDHPADDEEDEGDDEGEDEEDEDEDPSEKVVDADPEDEVAVGGMRDEALDDPDSESD